MPSKGVKWNMKVLDDALSRVPLALDAAAEYLRGKVVQNISKPTRELGPSKPGEFPHADTGRLRQSIFTFKIDELARGVGTNVEYGLIHETGERPFMRPTLLQEKKNLERLISKIAGGNVTIQIVEPDQPLSESGGPEVPT